MSEEKINTKDYWNMRFDTNWDDFGGSNQTEFFAKIACNLLPEWLKRKIKINKYTICDIGCALGNGVDVLSKYLSVDVVGVDFSEEAIHIAKERFPQYEFYIGNINDKSFKEKFDVIFCSNVLEHVYNPWDVMENFTENALHYIILLMPFRERLQIDEHVYKFNSDLIPMKINNFQLIYADTEDGEIMENTFYPGHQIFLVYSNNEEDKLLATLRDVSDGISKYEIQELVNKNKIEKINTNEVIANLNDRILSMKDELLEYQDNIEQNTEQINKYIEIQNKYIEQMNYNVSNEKELYNQISLLTVKEHEYQQTIHNLEGNEKDLLNTMDKTKQQLDIYIQNESRLNKKLDEYIDNENALHEEIEEYKCHEEKLREQLEGYIYNENKLNEQLNKYINNEKILKDKINQYIINENHLIKNLEQMNLVENKLSEYNNLLFERESAIQKALYQCRMMINSRLFKLVHFLNRLYYQGIKNDHIERKKFRRWFLSRIHGGGDADHRFNPMFSLMSILETKPTNISVDFKKVNSNILIKNQDCELTKHLIDEEKRLDNRLNGGKTQEAYELINIIKKREYKGILIYPHVVYWEPLQTPQQLLRAFSRLGWLCFFCEHHNIQNCYREVEPNLIITHESDLLMALENQPVTILLTWLGSLSFVNKINNKKIWYHVLDKLDIFPYYDYNYLFLHNDIVRNAQYVSYVAKPLINCLSERKDSIYLPNGTYPEDLINIHNEFIPDDILDIVLKKKKIIGYYGYLAEWMDYDTIADVARLRPDYEFVFIGKAIYDTSKIDNIPNVHLLGLKPYKDLSDYAKFFDVATIPFVINDMMDCVSPIKFYEYCALGLPVITSRMKEMETFQNEYVACYTNKDEYLFYLDRFTQNVIREKASKSAPIIAMNNTWVVRAKKMLSKFDSEQQLVLHEKYNKYDVIILSVIDYDFRYQRPQHFAARFAKNGHRVFYVNANFYRPTEVNKIEDNLYVVNFHNPDSPAIHLTDWADRKENLKALLDDLLYKYCIRDAITIVDYPNWIHGASYLRMKHGFKIITDYMDDFTGFLNPAEKLVGENCVELLKTNDIVIPSSQFLYDIAKKYVNNIDIVRNGTEFKHFNKAAKQTTHDRKVVGYYGAVAHWFDIKKICYVAENLKEVDFVIIGEVTEGKNKLQKYSNIKLLGEMQYSELPNHLEYFDVCLIPFDTSTDLIKATNPVKFYEYLSAGKKVVSTEIPELIPYKDKYVYMSNDDEQFLYYIKECLNKTDTLADHDECIKFAKENDWQVRYEDFSKLCTTIIPKVSIIVLTYNNLKLNKLCINSILNKTAYPNYELIIVDNLSTDGTREYLEGVRSKNIPNVKVILNDTNSGFAGGNNIGIKESTGDYVLLLNNDTIVTRGWLTSMVKHMENNPNIGMCGPVTNSIGNEAKIRIDYCNMNELNIFAYTYQWEHLDERYENPDMLALFCTLIRRSVIDKCGLLDEAYGLGMFEDDDYAEAVKKAGYHLAIAEDSFIHHFEGASFKKLEDKKFKDIFDVNKDIFEKKWKKKWKVQNFRNGVDCNSNFDIVFDVSDFDTQSFNM